MRRDLTVPGAACLAGLLVFLAGCDADLDAPTMPRTLPARGAKATGLVEGPAALPLQADAPKAEDLKGRPLPDFDLGEIQGGRVTKAGLAGKVALIEFWATWCGPCRRLSPLLEAFHRTYGPRGLVVIGANTSEQDAYGISIKSPNLATYYAKDNNLTYTFTYASDDFKEACQVQGLPTVLLVDRKGVVRDVWVGFNNDMEAPMRQAVEALLKP